MELTTVGPANWHAACPAPFPPPLDSARPPSPTAAAALQAIRLEDAV